MKHLITLMVALCLVVTTTQAQTIHAIVVCDTNDERTGKGAIRNLKHIQQLLQAIAASASYDLSTTVITSGTAKNSRKIKASDITGTLQMKMIKPQDIVFFYFSGHGGASRDHLDSLPIPSLNQNLSYTLTFKKIREKINQTNCRLSIVLGQLCNSYPRQKIELDECNSPKVKISNLHRVPKPILRQLFVEPSGNITATSAKKGSMSRSFLNYGGDFTWSFLRCIETARPSGNSMMAWNQLIEKTSLLQYYLTSVPSHFEVALN